MMTMGFGIRPPEINSALLFSGPGSGSMAATATAWEGLAAALHNAAASYRRATAAPQPYLDWLDATAARASQAAAQAKASETAFRSALATAVSPPEICANRATRVAAARANCLGHRAPAIADMDADYERMWALDADVMYRYARASAEATSIQPFGSPPGAAAAQGGRGRAAWVLRAAPDVMAVAPPVMSAIDRALRSLSRSPLATFDESFAQATAPLSRLSSLAAPTDFALRHLSGLNKEAALRRAAVLRSRWKRFGSADVAAGTAALGRGGRIGTLSVPHRWAAGAAADPAADPIATEGVCCRARLVHAAKPPKPAGDEAGVTRPS